MSGKLKEFGTLLDNVIEAFGYWKKYGNNLGYSEGSVIINGTKPLQKLHIKTDNADTNAVIGNFGHDYYGLAIESEDAILGLISENEGGHGSGIDLMEVNDGILQDKWWIGRFSSGGDSRLQWTYGSNADYASNTRMLDLTTDFKFILFNPAWKMAIGTQADPIGKLDITSEATGRVLGENNDLIIRTKDVATLGGLAEILFRVNENNVCGITAEYTDFDVSGLGGDLIFTTKEGVDAGLIERLRITNGGLVHIGIPGVSSAKLHVNSGDNNLVARFTSTDQFAQIFLEDDTSTVPDFVIREGNNTKFISGGNTHSTMDGNGNTGFGTNSPGTSCKVDIQSTTGALCVSRMTTGERDALTAVNGMILYNTSTNVFNFYENGAWVTK